MNLLGKNVRLKLYGFLIETNKNRIFRKKIQIGERERESENANGIASNGQTVERDPRRRQSIRSKVTFSSYALLQCNKKINT